MSNRKPEQQAMLMELPVTSDDAEVLARPKRRASAPPIAEQMTDPLAPTSDSIAGVMLVDPRLVAVDPVNARHGMVFDPVAQVELITSMSVVGNTVPVRLRPDPRGGYLCPSGSQRLGAALHIQREQPNFRLRAIISGTMDDREAFALGEADNVGRTGVQPMQQARQWAKMLDAVYGGDRQAFIAATGRSPSVVSRTLSLTALPDYLLVCCSDVEALTPYFAEQLAPRLADAEQEVEIRNRAEALGTAGKRLPGAKLVRVLLDGSPAAKSEVQTLWTSSDGTRFVRFKASATGGRFEVANIAGVAAAERRTLVKAFDALIKDLGAASAAS